MRTFSVNWWQLSYVERTWLQVRQISKIHILRHELRRDRSLSLSLQRSVPTTPAWYFRMTTITRSAYFNQAFIGSWFINRCSTLTERFRYTSNTVFDSFPGHKAKSERYQSRGRRSRGFCKKRNELRLKHTLSLCDLYRALDLPGSHPLKDAQNVLDNAVRKVYGIPRPRNR